MKKCQQRLLNNLVFIKKNIYINIFSLNKNKMKWLLLLLIGVVSIRNAIRKYFVFTFTKLRF